MLILCALRTFFTVYPELNILLIDRYMLFHAHAKLNDIIVLLVWLLVPFVVITSVVDLCKIQVGLLVYKTLFGPNIQALSTFWKIALSYMYFICTAVSLYYVFHVLTFIRNQWSVILSPLLRPLLIIPPVVITLQTMYQNVCLVECFVPIARRQIEADIRLRDRRDVLKYHVWLNITFIIHSVIIWIATRSAGKSQIPWEVMIEEFAYRIIAVWTFYKNFKNIDTDLQERREL